MAESGLAYVGFTACIIVTGAYLQRMAGRNGTGETVAMDDGNQYGLHPSSGWYGFVRIPVAEHYPGVSAFKNQRSDLDDGAVFLCAVSLYLCHLFSGCRAIDIPLVKNHAIIHQKRGEKIIENMNDMISLGVLGVIIFYIAGILIKSIRYQRLAKHIREEQKYYRNWNE